LCSELAMEGLTPSFELLQKTCSHLKIPVMVMIRPRPGNFVYSEEEISEMKVHIGRAKQAGAAGVVFGLLTAGGQIDVKNTAELAACASPLPVTFHKAIDELENPVSGVKILKKIKGIARILTSGGKPTAMEGAGIIREMIAAAAGKITILAAGKVTYSNAGEIGRLTGATEFHGRRIVNYQIEG